MKILSLIMLLTLALSCGKAPKESTSASVSSLKGKTKEEVLTLKYRGGITLYCALRAQKGETVDLMATPTSDFFWHMPEELSVFKILSYRIGKKEMVTMIKLARPMEFPEEQNYTDENLHEYYMEHSPVVSLAYKRAEKNILQDGTAHQRSGLVPATLRERIETRLFTKVIKDHEGEPHVVDVRCTVQTLIPPEYAHQWQMVK